MEYPGRTFTNIVSSIASTNLHWITIGFVDPVTDTQLESAIESKDWEGFDEAISRLAEQASNHGRRLQLKLHVRGTSQRN
jgi:hypothetical protein